MHYFSYPTGLTLARMFGVLIFIVVGLTFCLASMLSLVNSSFVPALFTFACGAGGLTGGIAQFIAYPTLTISDEGFQLNAGLYQSRWFSFEDVTAVNAISLPLGRKIIAVSVPALPRLFFWASFAGSPTSRGFLISNQIQDYDDLASLLQTARPDLMRINM